MLEVRNPYVANEIIKFIKEYFINLKNISKRLQLTVLNWRKKIDRNIRRITIYILNDFKRAHSKIYINFSASTWTNLRAADLMIKNIRLIKNFQANIFFDENFVENFSVTASRIDIIEINISTSSTRAVVLKFSILKIVSIILYKMLQSEKIN